MTLEHRSDRGGEFARDPRIEGGGEGAGLRSGERAGLNAGVRIAPQTARGASGKVGPQPAASAAGGAPGTLAVATLAHRASQFARAASMRPIASFKASRARNSGPNKMLPLHSSGLGWPG